VVLVLSLSLRAAAEGIAERRRRARIWRRRHWTIHPRTRRCAVCGRGFILVFVVILGLCAIAQRLPERRRRARIGWRRRRRSIEAGAWRLSAVRRRGLVGFVFILVVESAAEW